MQRDLVIRASHGDQDAFAVLAAGSVDRCYALAYRILRDAELARDAVQAALLGAWQDLPAIHDPDRFDAWLYRLVVRACHVEARQHRRLAATVRLLPGDHPRQPGAVMSVADRDQLDRRFRRLPREQRSVVVLHHYLGLPLAEVAATLGISTGTARSRLHHAMRQLQVALETDDRCAVTSRE